MIKSVLATSLLMILFASVSIAAGSAYQTDTDPISCRQEATSTASIISPISPPYFHNGIGSCIVTRHPILASSTKLSKQSQGKKKCGRVRIGSRNNSGRVCEDHKNETRHVCGEAYEKAKKRGMACD